MAIPQTQTILKSYLETGKKPTGAQLAELVDTLFFLYQDAKNTAGAAVTSVNNIAADAFAFAPDVFLIARATGAKPSVPITVVRKKGVDVVDHVESTSSFNSATIRFAQSFADTGYFVEVFNATIGLKATDRLTLFLTNGNSFMVRIYAAS